MQRLRIDDLRAAVPPSELPAGTELGVWQRSTGYEVIFPYRRSLGYWLIRILVLLALAAAVLGYLRPLSRGLDQVLIDVGLAAVLGAYVVYLLIRLMALHGARLRVDMTPLTLTVRRLEPAGPGVRLAEMPVRQIEDVWIDDRRGVRVNGKISDLSFGFWFGHGLRADDLYYIALLIGQVAARNTQSPHARV